MKLQRGATFLAIESIHITAEFRQRQTSRGADGKLEKTEDLEQSIKRRGMLNPHPPVAECLFDCG